MFRKKSILVMLVLFFFLYENGVVLSESLICGTQLITNSPKVTLTESGIPNAPILISPSNGTNSEDNTPTFTWTEVIGAIAYTLQIDNNSLFNSDNLVVFENITKTSFTIPTAMNHGRWYWRVQARNASGVSEFSEIWQYLIIPALTINTSEGLTTLVLVATIVVSIFVIISIGLWFRKKKSAQGILSNSRRPYSSTVLSGLLVLISALAPYAMLFQPYPDPHSPNLVYMINFVALFWEYLATADTAGFSFVSVYVLFFSLVIFVFQLVFVYSVYEYLQNRSTVLRTLGAWLISQIPIIFIGLPRYLFGVYPGLFFYSGPTFITLIAGLIIIRIFGPKEKEIWTEPQE